MALNLSAVGCETKVHQLRYDWKTLATYALGIGAKRDELAYLYEGVQGGMKVYPTFAVIPAFDPLVELMLKIGGDFSMVVHGGQSIRAHRAIPASETIETTGTLSGIYDQGKFAQAVIETRSRIQGEPLFDTRWSLLFRGAGNFGGPRPPEDPAAPNIPESRPPDWIVEEATLPEQALLYRLSGDVNPLHADPAIAAKAGFEQGPILQGLSSYGFVARAIVKNACGGDATRLASFTCQFRRPVWPGDVIVTEGHALGDGRVAVRVTVKGRPEPVLTSAWAEIT